MFLTTMGTGGRIAPLMHIVSTRFKLPNMSTQEALWIHTPERSAECWGRVGLWLRSQAAATPVLDMGSDQQTVTEQKLFPKRYQFLQGQRLQQSLCHGDVC